MKIALVTIVVIAAAALAAWFLRGGSRPEGAHSRRPILDYAYTSIAGERVPLSSYRGKYILFVNVASRCGFTPQYAGLETLSVRHRDRLVVLGFPANDFLGQEPGTNAEIRTFCTTRYGVTFPLSEKVSVVGSAQCEIYRWLSDARLNGWNDAAPKWNFTKYLVDPQGELLRVFPSSTEPLDTAITGLLR